MSLTLTVLSLVAAGFADVRWLRVAQREHYLPGTVTRFAGRWWKAPGVNAMLAALALVNVVLVPSLAAAAVVPAIVVILGPLGLGVRGRTSKLAWTLRLKTLAAIAVTLQLVVVAIAAVLGSALMGAVLVAVLAPIIVDLALILAKPIEERRAAHFVDAATKRLRAVAPTVVGITGSYGKTSTKNFVGHLLQGRRTAVLTPASFNNRAGLSRSINEHLTPGTDVFVAEMGTYGPGEIAELCRLCPPDIAVFTAVGPVHLERFGTEEVIIESKSEIFEPASVAVLNVDDSRLAAVADKLEQAGKTVWRCSTSNVEADVCLRPQSGGDDGADDVERQVTLYLKGAEQGRVSVPDVPIGNVACAVAVALQLDVAVDEIISRLPGLVTPAHRQQVTVTTDGLTVIDDTYNANPAGVRRGLEVLSRAGRAGARRVVATPGMVELGQRQDFENEEFMRAAVAVATDVVIIGRTNRKALRRGATSAAANVVEVDTLPQAVAWVRKHVGSGDAVLYANDLPDHFA